MKCPRCKCDALDGGDACLISDSDATIVWRRECKCGNEFKTIERRCSYRHKGVRFDVLIGDDEPGARKP